MTLEEQAFDQEIEDAGLPYRSFQNFTMKSWMAWWICGESGWWRWMLYSIPNEKTSKHWDIRQQSWVWVKGNLSPAKIRWWGTTFTQHPRWNDVGRISIPTFWLMSGCSTAFNSYGLASLSRQGGDCRQKSFAEARSIEGMESIEPKNRWAHLSTDLE